MGGLLWVLLVVPLVSSLVAAVAPSRLGRPTVAASGLVSFGASLALIGHPRASVLGGWVSVDPLAVVFLVAVAFLYLATLVFALGYAPRGSHAHGDERYQRRLFAGLGLFCWAMLAAPMMSSLALLWVAIEITTVVSALLVAIDDTDGSAEAAWKYVLIASLGLGIALLATLIAYESGVGALGHSFDFFYRQLDALGGRLPKELVRLAYVLAVVGFGTKVGFFPVHTWLPDAHSEAPTPVSALLSGALLAVSFYAVLRYFQVAEQSVGAGFARDVLLAFGLASLGLAAIVLGVQRDIKRLFAYSSIEQMGIIAVGASFGAKIAVVGMLLQVLAHAAAKGTAFFGAGSVVRKLGTKDLGRMQGVIGLLPWSGPMLMLSVLALSAMPPFGIFRSEFMIVLGGLDNGSDAAVAVLVALVTVAYFGMSWYAAQAMFSPTKGALERGETSWWIVGAMGLGLVALGVLGVHPPGELLHLLDAAASELGVRR